MQKQKNDLGKNTKPSWEEFGYEHPSFMQTTEWKRQ